MIRAYFGVALCEPYRIDAETRSGRVWWMVCRDGQAVDCSLAIEDLREYAGNPIDFDRVRAAARDAERRIGARPATPRRQLA